MTALLLLNYNSWYFCTLVTSRHLTRPFCSFMVWYCTNPILLLTLFLICFLLLTLFLICFLLLTLFLICCDKIWEALSRFVDSYGFVAWTDEEHLIEKSDKNCRHHFWYSRTYQQELAWVGELFCSGFNRSVAKWSSAFSKDATGLSKNATKFVFQIRRSVGCRVVSDHRLLLSGGILRMLICDCNR